MGNILEPSVITPVEKECDDNALKHGNYLSELETEDEKSVARENLGVYGKETTYSKDETNNLVLEKLNTALRHYFSSSELPVVLASLRDEIAEAGYVRSDGSVPFTNPQSQSSLPTLEEHLVNKVYVDTLLKTHERQSDPHKTLEKVKLLLADYVRLKDTYTTSELYSKRELDCKLNKFVKKDGSVPFVSPQLGVDPTLPGHLVTLRHLNLLLQNHNSELDPHGFLEILKSHLGNYYTKSETYTKAQTYSRAQLLEIIKSQMKDVVDQAIARYKATDGSVSELKDFVLEHMLSCIKADGSVAHIAPQPGVPAVNDNEFITLGQLAESLDKLSEKVAESIKSATNQSVWIPTGPVRTTVGFVEDNTVMPKQMTVQQICDAIFYGRRTGIEAPKYAEKGEKVCIKILAQGTVQEIDVYKNGKLIGTITESDLAGKDDSLPYFEYCDPGEFTEDTEWKVVFRFPDGQTLVDTATTKLAFPIFIGAMPYWWNVQEDITMESLKRLAKEDPDNNAFYSNFGPDVEEIKATFNFADAQRRSLIVAYPTGSNEAPENKLSKMITEAQVIPASDSNFAHWKQPMHPNDSEVGVLYNISVFNQPLVKMDTWAKFKFEPNA